MGGGSYSSSQWTSYARSTATKSASQIYSQSQIHKDLNPLNVKIRESRDSTEHPESCPVAVFTDVTGSMGYLSEAIAKKAVGVLFEELLERQPVKDPQLMFGAIGDVWSDEAPLQVSQFESDNRIVEQLENIWLEGRGGGNGGESYDIPWYFMATHTSTDSFEKRQHKGYIFTIGDEPIPHGLRVDEVKKFIGDDIESDLTPEQSLKMAERYYNVYHIIVGNNTYNGDFKKGWTNLLGERAVVLEDHTKLAELIVSLIQLNEGMMTKAQVVDSWNGDTSLVIAKSIKDISVGSAKISQSGVVTL